MKILNEVRYSEDGAHDGPMALTALSFIHPRHHRSGGELKAARCDARVVTRVPAELLCHDSMLGPNEYYLWMPWSAMVMVDLGGQDTLLRRIFSYTQRKAFSQTVH